MAAAEATTRAPTRADGALGGARAAREEGDTAYARTLLRSSLRYAVGSGYAIVVIDALETMGSLEARDGDAEDAARMLSAVEAERERIGYVRFPVERPTFERSVADLRGRLGDGFDDVWADGGGLSLTDTVALASREGRPPRPPSGWESLTPAEMRVVRLVGEGLTNPQIGERLFISPRTVQSHLRHVFEKLGLSRRTELAAEVSRLERETSA